VEVRTHAPTLSLKPVPDAAGIVIELHAAPRKAWVETKRLTGNTSSYEDIEMARRASGESGYS